MKKHLAKLLFIVSVLSIALLSSCNIVSSLNIKSSQKQSSKTTSTIKLLNKKDFSVTDGTYTIAIDMLYRDSIAHRKEKKMATNLVTERVSGDYLYKYYFHEYDDFTIYDSNDNWNLKNRSMADYYITEIILKDTLI